MSGSAAAPAKGNEPQDGFLFTAGPALVSGAAQAVLFNPVDRALYVRVKHRRKRFLDWRNFERPFQGFFNAAVYRTLVGASYMFWQDSARIYITRFLPEYCQADVSPQLNSFIIGLFAGSINGLALNMLQAVKFRMWNSDKRGVTFASTARLMYHEAGIPIFFRGCMTTVVRDSVFGVVYETMRRSRAWKDFFYENVTAAMAGGWLDREPSEAAEKPTRATERRTSAATAAHSPCGTCSFLSNLVAAIVASMLSSPFNYVRSVVYGTPPGAIPLGYWPLLKSFYTQFFYIWRNGQSYTELYGIPKLEEVEHSTGKARPDGGRAEAAAATARHSTSTGGPRPSPASTGAPASSAEPQGSHGDCRATRQRLHAHHRRHHHHPIAACKWANSRLNIGWGSVRVGLGMAMSQSLFHLAQNYARDCSARETSR